MAFHYPSTKREPSSRRRNGVPRSISTCTEPGCKTPGGKRGLPRRASQVDDDYISAMFSQVEKNCKAAADLVRACAFLHSEGIAEEIFAKSGKLFGEEFRSAVANPLQFAETLKEACQYSLIQRNPSDRTLEIHRVVQQVLHDEMNETEQRHWADRTTRAVNAIFPTFSSPYMDLVNRLLPHAERCAALIMDWDLDSPAAGMLVFKVGFIYALSGEAEPLYRVAAAILMEIKRPNRHVRRAFTNMGRHFHNHGKLREAEALYKRGVATNLLPRRSNYRDIEEPLLRLACLYFEQGRYVQAEPYYRQVLAMAEEVLGPDHPTTAYRAGHLGVLFHDWGEPAVAEPFYRRVLEALEKPLAKGCYDLAIFLYGYSDLLRETERLTEAREMETRAEEVLAGQRLERPSGPWLVRIPTDA